MSFDSNRSENELKPLTDDKRSIVQMDLRLNRAFGAEDISRADIEGVRTLLKGSSFVDSSSLYFRKRQSVEHFLNLLCYDIEDPWDKEILLKVLNESVRYLSTQHGFEVPEELFDLQDPVLPFLWASQPGPLFQASLMLLKVAHVLFHVRSRNLRHNLPVSDSELYSLASERLRAFRTMLRGSGIDVVAIDSSQKAVDSTILKLLSKRENHAARIYDRIRFRIIIRDRLEMLPTLLMMTRHLFPSNYVVPTESRNDLVSYEQMLQNLNQMSPGVPVIEDAIERERESSLGAVRNEFSHPDFEMINFVVDVPLRVDRFAERTHPSVFEEHGRVVFSLMEFQVFDLKTFMRNEQGPGSHAHYKARQRHAVLERLVGIDSVNAWRSPKG